MVCFWCGVNINPNNFFEDYLKYFVVTKNGEIFEKPTIGHSKFNRLYQDTFNVELCNYCFYNLDMYNKTGLWCDYELF